MHDLALHAPGMLASSESSLHHLELTGSGTSVSQEQVHVSVSVYLHCLGTFASPITLRYFFDLQPGSSVSPTNPSSSSGLGSCIWACLEIR